jgi:hypothetical protein
MGESFPAKQREVEKKEGPQYRELYYIVDIDTFRFYLIRWIVERHILFTIIEDINF